MINENYIDRIRKDYQTERLKKDNSADNPFVQFKNWFHEALKAEFIEANAMNIATVSKAGEISSRMVLLKSFDEVGFVFFTNYDSNKSKDLQETKKAALNFWWDKLHRQVRISGIVEKVSRDESENYFDSRPRGSQFGAMASKQSQVLDTYEVLEKQYEDLEKKYGDKKLTCPDYWGGFRVIPNLFEFWQGQPNRLHDRLRYTKTSTDDWMIERLSP